MHCMVVTVDVEIVTSPPTVSNTEKEGNGPGDVESRPPTEMDT